MVFVKSISAEIKYEMRIKISGLLFFVGLNAETSLAVSFTKSRYHNWLNQIGPFVTNNLNGSVLTVSLLLKNMRQIHNVCHHNCKDTFTIFLSTLV